MSGKARHNMAAAMMESHICYGIGSGVGFPGAALMTAGKPSAQAIRECVPDGNCWCSAGANGLPSKLGGSMDTIFAYIFVTAVFIIFIIVLWIGRQRDVKEGKPR